MKRSIAGHKGKYTDSERLQMLMLQPTSVTNLTAGAKLAHASPKIQQEKVKKEGEVSLRSTKKLSPEKPRKKKIAASTYQKHSTGQIWSHNTAHQYKI